MTAIAKCRGIGGFETGVLFSPSHKVGTVKTRSWRPKLASTPLAGPLVPSSYIEGEGFIRGINFYHTSSSTPALYATPEHARRQRE